MGLIDDLDKINELTNGWTIERIEEGRGENLWILHLKKGVNSRRVILAANDLGGWLGDNKG